MKKTPLLLTSIFAASISIQAQTTVMSDGFGNGTTSNNSDINAGSPGRQSGTTLSNYTGTGANNVFHISNDDGGVTSTNAAPTNNMARIRNNEQTAPGGSNGFLSLDSNFSALAGTNYTISFDLLYNQRNTDSTDQWVSFSLGDTVSQEGPNNANSDFGILMRPADVGNPNDGLARFYSDNAFNVANDSTTTPSFVGQYVNFVISVTEFGVANPTISVTANGSSILSNFEVDFDSTGRYFSFGSHLGTDADTAGAEFADTFIDNLSITVVPEPGTYALIGGLLTLGFVALKRRK